MTSTATPRASASTPKTTGRPPVRAASAQEYAVDDGDRAGAAEPARADLGGAGDQRAETDQHAQHPQHERGPRAADPLGPGPQAARPRLACWAVFGSSVALRGSGVLGGSAVSGGATTSVRVAGLDAFGPPRRREGRSARRRGADLDTAGKVTDAGWPARGWSAAWSRTSASSVGAQHLGVRRRPRPARRRAGRRPSSARCSAAPGWPAATHEDGVLDRPGAHQGAPVVDLARAGDPGGRDDQHLGAGVDQRPGELGEAQVVAGHQPDPEAADVDHHRRSAGAGGQPVGLAVAEGVVEVDLAVRRRGGARGPPGC